MCRILMMTHYQSGLSSCQTLKLVYRYVWVVPQPRKRARRRKTKRNSDRIRHAFFNLSCCCRSPCHRKWKTFGVRWRGLISDVFEGFFTLTNLIWFLTLTTTIDPCCFRNNLLPLRFFSERDIAFFWVQLGALVRSDENWIFLDFPFLSSRAKHYHHSHLYKLCVKRITGPKLKILLFSGVSESSAYRETEMLISNFSTLTCNRSLEKNAQGQPG